MSVPSTVVSRPKTAPKRQRVRLVSLIGVQVFPLIALATVYPSIAVTLHRFAIVDVPLATLIVSAAVLGPLLAQTVSGPIYRGIDGVSRSERSSISRAALRMTPIALLIGVPIAAATAALIAHVLGWSLPATEVFVGVVELHLVLSALLVPAYAVGAQFSLLAVWSVYAAVLALNPTLVWAPATAAIALQLVFAVVRARGSRRVPFVRRRVPATVLLASSVRAVADALPLWSVPIAVFAVDPRHFVAGPVFAGMLPAIIAYHVYFQTAAEPLWHRIDELRRAMGDHPYDEIARDTAELAHRARMGVARVFALLLLLGIVTVIVIGAAKWGGIALFLSVLVVSGLSVILLAQVYTLSMLYSSGPVIATAVVLVGAVAAAVALHFSVDSTLILLAAMFALLSLVIAAANNQAWKLPEYALFWKSALSQ